MNDPAGRRTVGALLDRFIGSIMLAVVVVAMGGCRSATPLPPLNLSEPGWQVRQGQAVWQARPHLPALAGEVILAWNRDGRVFAQFSKTPFTVLNARASVLEWRIEFPAQRRSYQGAGQPPGRFAWLHLPRALAGQQLPADLIMTPRDDGHWSLANRRTGELIEGCLSP
jgi:hypothetical protein